MKRIISIVFFLVLVFYYLYPSALPLFGYSFVFALGIVGLMSYIYHKFPYSEVVSVLLPFGLMFVWAFFSSFMNGVSDSFIIDYAKSQMGWFFGAYFTIHIFYKIHPKGGFHLILYYIIAAIVIQCIISVAMYMDPAINDFFNSIQKIDELEALKRERTEGVRLLGYGTAFFGAGMACGFGLILLAYIITTRKLNFFQLLLVSSVYCSIFYIGLLSARTTLVGFFMSLALILILMIMRGGHKEQVFYYLLYSAILLTIGYTLSYVYFPEFADWAFEAFINYEQTGEFRTFSSDALEGMFVLPEDMFTWIFGMGIGSYMFTDVGYSRLLLWFGLPGAILFFYYQILILKQSFTKDKMLDLLLLVIIVYSFILNYKGLADLNAYAYLFAFYFLYYRYYIYTPYLYRLGRLNQAKLRYAVQTQTTGRRV